MAIKPLPSAEELHRLFEYRDGRLYRRVSTSRRVKIGQVAGGITPEGYTTVRVAGMKYMTHRLIWKMHISTDPPSFIDHINRDRADNRIENLRLATHAQNTRNSRQRADITTRLKGVTPRNNKFLAQIQHNKKKLHLGYFNTPEEAHEAYKQAALKHHGEFANFGG